MTKASTIRIIAIIITFVLIAQCVPNIIYYSMIAHSDSFGGTNKGISMFMMYLNIVLIVVGLCIIVYLLVSGLTKEKEPDILQPIYYQRPEKEEKQQPSVEKEEKQQPSVEKEEIMNIRGLGDPMISKRETDMIEQSLLFSD